VKRGEDNNGRYVVRDGRKIYVDVLDTGIVAHKRRDKDDLFSVLYHKHSVPAIKALGSPGALVWVALMWRARIERRHTVKLPTKLLKLWGSARPGVSRSVRATPTPIPDFLGSGFLVS
jgi:hypothetical protein